MVNVGKYRMLWDWKFSFCSREGGLSIKEDKYRIGDHNIPYVKCLRVRNMYKKAIALLCYGTP